MKRPRLWLPIGLFASMIAVLATMPFVASADTFQFSGKGAEAGFFSRGADGSSTSAFVFAGDFTTRSHDPPGGPPETFSGTEAEIFISQFFPGNPEDPSDDVFRDIFGSARDVSFQVDRELTSASLITDISARVCEGRGREPAEPGDGRPPQPPSECTETTLQVNLTWTGVGNLSHEGGNNHFRSDGFIVNSHFNGTRREAEARGSITDGVTEFIGDITGFGSLFEARSGEVFID